MSDDSDEEWLKFWAVAVLIIVTATIVTTWKPVQINVITNYPVESKEASR